MLSRILAFEHLQEHEIHVQGSAIFLNPFTLSLLNKYSLGNDKQFLVGGIQYESLKSSGVARISLTPDSARLADKVQLTHLS